MLYTFSEIANLRNQADRLSAIQPLSVGALSILSFGLFVILLSSHSRMKKAIGTVSEEPILPPIDDRAPS
jgi:hypothetical protein